MPKTDPLTETVNAIAILRDHGTECFCSHCEISKNVIARNQETASKLMRLMK